MSDTKPLEVKDWLDEQEFFDICQSYRHSQDIVPDFPGMPTAAEAFETLKKYIRDQLKDRYYIDRTYEPVDEG